MSMAAFDPALSLVERKKLQWAKEKEELDALNKHWNITEENRKQFERTKRRSSLPPLYKNQYNSCDKFDRDKEIGGGETSGYGSDNPNQSPDCVQTWTNHQAGYESSSSRDDRMKWSDKTKFWQQQQQTKDESEPPNWVKRGLKGEEIVINNTSPAESPEQDRPQTGSSYSQNNRNTYLRGQNIRIDSIELAERERRRQVALAHQDAIRRQLEERERKRQQEKERKIKEEYEEELRIEREQEVERKRREEEYKAMQEKMERERKRKEAIEEAIELAQKEAKSRKNVNVNVKEVKEKFSGNEENIVNNNLEIRGKSISPREAKSEEKISENLTLLIPAKIENFPNVHYALLIPATPPPSHRTENRILTPTQFRDKNKKLCDTSTQTDESIFVRAEQEEEEEEEEEEKMETRIRKERRSRSESVDERPKWGANRPPTRYVKQSDKDPNYQRRKLRQKLRDDKNSSDESRAASPRFRKRGSVEKRYARHHWRKEELVPLVSDKDRIYYKINDCRCVCRCDKNRIDILKIDHDIIEKLPVMEKLNSLENGLRNKREQWENVTLPSTS